MEVAFTLAQLEQRVKMNRKRLLARQKEYYELAKDLGFSPEEAIILQNHKKQTIINLAKERQVKNA